MPGGRAVIIVHADRISDTCGYAVPLYTFEGQRSRLIEWAQERTEAEMDEYRSLKNSSSIDGLPAIPAVTPGSTLAQ